MVSKYQTAQLIGVILNQNANGQYEIENNRLKLPDFHSWRIGKHTKGKLGMPGQVFLTEKNMAVVLVEIKALSFKDRHNYLSIGRFTNERLSDKQVIMVRKEYFKLCDK